MDLGDKKMKEHRKKPKNLGVKLGEVNYGSKGKREDKWQIYNKNGRAYAVKYSEKGKRWLVSDRHIGMGYMLKQLGIEFSATGQIFVPWQYKEKTGRKTFRGMTRKQIINAQKKY
jgi:hypothetical protein